MFGPLNPKTPYTRASDASLVATPQGLRLNTANANTWSAAQSFNGNAVFNSTVSNNSYLYNYGYIYDYGYYTNTGTMNVATVYATNTISSLVGLTTYTPYGTFYENPYSYTYNLTYSPVSPGTINGGSSDGGTLSDDGYGNISSSLYGVIATIDYNTGAVTDATSGSVYTLSINYYVPATGYSSLYPSGQANFYTTTLQVAVNDPNYSAALFASDGMNSVTLCNGNPLTVNGSVGYTGALNDSTSTQIADVVGGIIVTTYF